ncbi:hypothetical protein ACTXBQ_005281, partial [Escherichia coli]
TLVKIHTITTQQYQYLMLLPEPIRAFFTHKKCPSGEGHVCMHILFLAWCRVPPGEFSIST